MICLIAFLAIGVVILRRGPAKHLPDYGDIIQFDPNREGGHLLPGLDMLMQGERTG